MKILMCFLISIYMFLIGNLIYISKQKHLLIILLSLEFMVLSIYFLLVVYYMFLDYNLYFLMVYLVFSVCEGALGLSILVTIVRSYGNDFFQSFNILM